MVGLLLASLVATQAWSWTNFSVSSGLPSDRVERVVETRTGRVWANTSLGLAYYDGMRWCPLAGPLQLPERPAISLAAMPDGDSLLVAYEDAVYIAEESRFRRVFVADGGRVVQGAVPYEGDALVLQIWTGGDHPQTELFQLSGDATLTPFSCPAKLATSRHPNLYRTSNGAIFVNTLDGLYR